MSENLYLFIWSFDNVFNFCIKIKIKIKIWSKLVMVKLGINFSSD